MPETPDIAFEDPLVATRRSAGSRISSGIAIVLGALLLHVVGGVAIWVLAPLLDIKAPPPKDHAVEVAVVETAPEPPKPPEPPPKPPEPKVEAPRPPEPKPEPKPKPKPKPKPAPEKAEPPPPDAPPKATQPMDPVNLEGLTMESTAKGGDFAIKVGKGIDSGQITNKYVDPNRLDKIVTKKGGTGEGYGSPQAYASPKKHCKTVKAHVKKRVKGVYPPQAKQRRLEGVVIAVVTVDAHGKVTAVKIVKSAGHGFDEAAAAAFRKWTFSPAMKDCHAVTSDVRVTHGFSLEDF